MITINLDLFRKILLLWLLSIMLSGCLGKGHMPKPQSGDFNGEVIDTFTKEPVPGVTVMLGGGQVITDNGGQFSIAVLPPGEYDMIMERSWYKMGTFHIKHVGEKDVRTFELESEPINGKILYSGDRDKNREIYELDLWTRGVTRLTYLPDSSEIHPVKLPENQVIFQSDQNGYEDLFTYDFVNSPVKIPCGGRMKNQAPSIDRSGLKLVFKSTGESPGKIYLFYMKRITPLSIAIPAIPV